MSIPYVVDGETDLDSLLFNPIIDRVNGDAGPLANMRAGIFNVLDYGAVGDGTTDDTTAIAAAFTAADQHGAVSFPPGTYLTGAIAYRGQSIIGAGSNLTTIKGKPGQDVFRCEDGVSASSRERPTFSGFTVVVDDSTDASASFPDRDGVGNAGFAVDFPDGAGTVPYAPFHAKWADVRFHGLSDLVGGQNKSCGIYEQAPACIGASFRNIQFDRLAFGWYQDAPRSNLLSCEIARDMVTGSHLYFNGCNKGWRIHNNLSCDFRSVSFHSFVDTAITFAADQTVSRGANLYLSFANLYMETGLHPFGWEGGLTTSTFVNMSLGPDDPDEPILWDGNLCRFVNSGMALGTSTSQPVLTITGDRNYFELYTSGGILDPTLVDDQGDGNIVWITKFAADSGAAIYRIPINRSAYTATNVSTDRSFDANSTTLDEVADVLGTLLQDLREMGIIR